MWKKGKKKMMNEELFDGALWDDVMFAMFSQAENEEKIAEELDKMWNE